MPCTSPSFFTSTTTKFPAKVVSSHRLMMLPFIRRGAWV